MAIEFSEIVVPVISSVVTVIFVFYIKGFLSDRSAYSKLRKKLENVAGKNATIVYAGAGDIGGTLYKIIEIGKEGITIENPVHKIFLPVSQVLRLPMVLPVDDYKTIKEDYEKEQLEKVSGALFDPLFEKLEESFEKNVTQPGSEIGASIEVKVINILEEKGLLIAAPSEK